MAASTLPSVVVVRLDVLDVLDDDVVELGVRLSLVVDARLGLALGAAGADRDRRL